jgi:hypothetical protein
MKFALLGWNPNVLSLLRAVSADSQHELTAAVEIPSESMGELLAAAPGIRIQESWEELLVDTAADATLVAGDSDSVQAGAKQLAVDDRTLALVPQASQSSAFVYELTLTHDDNKVPLVPVPHLSVHPLVVKLHELIQQGELGQLMLQRVERTVPAGPRTDGSSAAGLTRDEVDGALLGDVPLLRFLGGNYNRITAVNSGSEETRITQATVTLGGNDLAQATWTARPGAPAWSLEISGSHGSATLTLEDDLAGTLVVSPSASSAPPEVKPESSLSDDGSGLGANQLAALQQSLEDSTTHWVEMTRAFETVEATHTSLRRRRTIDLFFETTSERSIFKSQMTAVGCGLIMLTLFGLVAFLLVGAFVDSNSRMQDNAKADKRMIYDSEFVADTAQLNATGLKHISEISREVQQSAETVFVMPASDDSDGKVNTNRVAAVVVTLVQSGHADSAAFVQIASVPHPATLILLQVLRILWITPLVLFLVMQSLLFVTRPSSSDEPANDAPTAH